MDNRHYNLMVTEAEQQVRQMLMDFERQFYSRRIQNAEKRTGIMSALQEIMQEPEPLPPVDEGMDMLMPEFEEESYG